MLRKNMILGLYNALIMPVTNRYAYIVLFLHSSEDFIPVKKRVTLQRLEYRYRYSFYINYKNEYFHFTFFYFFLVEFVDLFINLEMVFLALSCLVNVFSLCNNRLLPEDAAMVHIF